MQDFMAAIQAKDKNKVSHLLHSKQGIGKQIERTAYVYGNFSHLLIRLEKNIVKEKELNSFFLTA